MKRKRRSSRLSITPIARNLSYWPSPIQILRGAVDRYHANLRRAGLQKRSVNRPFTYFFNPQTSKFRPPIERFRYLSTLDEKTIRLVSLSYGSSTDPVRMRMIEVGLDDAPPYLALSYVWGEETDRCNVLCDDQSLAVTRNLFEALRQILELYCQSQGREDEDSRNLFWIDAICINQGDKNEKSRQVRRMFDIYRNASAVIAWLGKGDAKLTECIDFCHQLSLKLANHDLQYGYLLVHLDNASPSPIDGLSIPDVSEQVWETFVQILERPWFTRIWVIQEILASDNAYFLLGSDLFEASRFLQLVMALCETTFFLAAANYRRRGKFSPRNVQALSLMRMKSGQMSLIEIIWMLREFQAKDERDKIFAVAHFSHDAPLDVVDYDLSLEQILISLTKEALRQGSASLLSYACTARREETSSMPSWITTIHPISDEIEPLAALFPQKVTEITRIMEPAIITERNDHSIVLSGMIFDKIKFMIRNPHRRPDHGDFDDTDRFSRVEAEMSAKNVERRLQAIEYLKRVSTLEDEALIELYYRCMAMDNDATTPFDKIAAFREHHERYATRAAEVEARHRRFTRFTAISIRLLEWMGHWATIATITYAPLLYFSVRYLVFRPLRWSEIPKVFLICILPIEVFMTIVKFVGKMFKSEQEKLDMIQMEFQRKSGSQMRLIAQRTHGRHFIVTDKGAIGWAGPTAVVRDELCFFGGSRIPFILHRERSQNHISGNTYRLQADCYVHGLMAGGIENFHDLEEVNITLV